MAVNDIAARRRKATGRNRARATTIRRAGVAPDPRGFDAEAKAARNCRERLIDARAEALAVEEHADVVTARRLLAGKIDDMSKQSAERRAEDVYDPEFADRAVEEIRRQWVIRILPVTLPRFR